MFYYGNFSINGIDKCLYTKYEKGKCLIIYLNIDYMLIIVFRTKLFLGLKFEIKDVNRTIVILGVTIIRSEDSILLSQEQYIVIPRTIYRKFGYYDFKLVSNIYDANSKLEKIIRESIAFNELF